MDKHPEQLLVEVVRQLKELRLSRGISHENLAKSSGVTRPMISFIESGRSRPSLLVALKICSALDVSLAKLINDAEKQ